MRVNPLKKYKELLAAGHTDDQAYLLAESLAHAGEPEVNLELIFEKIGSKFSSFEQKLKYIEWIVGGTALAIMGAIVCSFFK